MGSPRNNQVRSRMIEYNDEEYQSILEAKWAYAFDLAGLNYEYEPRSFFLRDRSVYVPDFRITFDNGYELWIEAKGKLWADDESKMKEFAEDHDLYIVSDLPMTFCDMIEDDKHPWAYVWKHSDERVGFGINKDGCFGLIPKAQCDLRATKSFYRRVIDAWKSGRIPNKPKPLFGKRSEDAEG